MGAYCELKRLSILHKMLSFISKVSPTAAMEAGVAEAPPLRMQLRKVLREIGEVRRAQKQGFQYMTVKLLKLEDGVTEGMAREAFGYEVEEQGYVPVSTPEAQLNVPGAPDIVLVKGAVRKVAAP